MRLPAADPDPVAGRAALKGLKVTWLGHATLLITSPKGVRLLVDPFLTNNPSCPAAAKRISALDLVLVTHGHSDHCEDAVAVRAKRARPSSRRRSSQHGSSARV